VRLLFAAISWLVLVLFQSALPAQDRPLIVGSKKFTESVILGEMATQMIMQPGVQAEHQSELGGTRVLWRALLTGAIDIYPEYTGTLVHEIFSGLTIRDLSQLEVVLANAGVHMTQPFGFNNTYILGMRETRADRLGITRIADLLKHPELRFGFSNEFMQRADGWPGLRARYKLPHQHVRGLDHDLAYRGLVSGSLDVMDLYSTDAEINYYRIRPLQDDLDYFPDYYAIYLYRAELAATHPGLVQRLKQLQGKIDNAAMRGLNTEVKINKKTEAAVAAGYLAKNLGLEAVIKHETVFTRFMRNTYEHLSLVLVSLTAAILVAIPLGILSAKKAGASRFILAGTSVLQTIPSLALFVFMIPLLGIGGPPAIAVLFLYSLLPIVRNTYSGLQDIPADIKESALAIGLPATARLLKIELPLATRSILAGIKTAAVINVGTATLGALIGAGGYGQPILAGIRLDDMGLILEGAVPAALLALAVQALFDLVERFALPGKLKQ